MVRFGEKLNIERQKDFEETIKYYRAFRIEEQFFEKQNLTLMGQIHKLVGSLSIVSVIEGIPEYSMPYLAQLQSDSIQLINSAILGTERGFKLFERSLIENTLRYIYYSHHEIEHNLLQTNSSSYLNFRELCDYVKSHPFFKESKAEVEKSVGVLHSKYSELSRVVHAGTMKEMSLVRGIVSLHKPMANLDKEIDSFNIISQNIMYLLGLFHKDKVSLLDGDECRILTLLLSRQQKNELCNLA